MWKSLKATFSIKNKQTFLQKAFRSRFRKDIDTGFPLMIKVWKCRYAKTVASESGCGPASLLEQDWSIYQLQLFLCPGFHEENSDTFIRHLCHDPEVPLLCRIKSVNKSCRRFLWDKQAVCANLLVFPYFIKFWSAKT